MRKPVVLIILILLGTGGLYLGGVLTGSPRDGRFRLDEMIRRGGNEAPGQELNRKGVLELNGGNPEEAVPVLREALTLEPDNKVIARNLSIALARVAGQNTGDDQSALKLLEESLGIWPKNTEALDALSAIHFKAARYQEALEPALVLLEMFPDRTDLARYVTHLQEKVAEEQGMSSERGDRFRLLYSDRRKLDFEGDLLSILQTQLDSLTVALGIFPDRPIDVLLLTDDLGARADPRDPFLEGIYDGQIHLYLGSGRIDRQKLIPTVRHEMVHALLHQAAGNLPGWVQEGLAQKAGEAPGEEHLRAARRYLAGRMREGYPVDLGSMGITFLNLDEDSRTAAYAASLLFMDHLSRVYGDGFIPRFVAELMSGASPPEALRSVTGRTFDQLQASFSDELEGGI